MSDQTFSINDLLGLLADDLGRAEPNDDARNVAAAALVAAFNGPLEEFSVRRAILLPNWQPLEARAREAAVLEKRKKVQEKLNLINNVSICIDVSLRFVHLPGVVHT